MMAKILNWNINGLNGKIGHLEAMLAEQMPEVLAITDTRLSPNTNLRIRGYVVYRKDGDPGRAGGVALLVRSDIPSIRLDTPGTDDQPGYSVITISAKMKYRHKITCIYRRPWSRLEYIKALLAETQQDRNHILLGDLNATHTDWN